MKILNDIKNILRHRSSRNCLAVLSGIVTLVMLMSILVVKRNSVYIYVDGECVSNIETIANEKEIWLDKSGVAVYEGDIVKTDGCNLYIDRAVFVTVLADGDNITFKSAKGTVSQVLENGKISVGASDIVKPALDSAVSGNITIEIDRVTTATVTETEIVKHETKKQKTNELYEGQTEVITKGEDGKTEHIYNITYINGKETSRELVKTTVVSEPVTEVVKVGTRIKSSFKKTASTPKNYKAVIAMNGSAYTYGNDGGNVTALGKPTARGIVAVDPNVIPLGTRLYIESADGKYIYGEAIAGDTGGAIKGNKIDLFVESKTECRQFGRRTVNVYILD